METSTLQPLNLQSWRFLTTQTLSGEENMRCDAETLERVGRGDLPPTLRLFRFNKPTVSYGRLQKLEHIAALVPEGWDTIVRPTGGGIVFHETDLCVSLTWPKGEAHIPSKPKDTYQWIHSLIRKGLNDSLRMACCTDTSASKKPFELRECFTEPVGYDLLSGSQKVVGGALRSTRDAVLYQGSIQLPNLPTYEPTLLAAFTTALRLPLVFSLPRPKIHFMIAVLGFTAFMPALNMGFLWDDHIMIEANPHVREWSVENVRHDFTSDVFEGRGDPYYRPMQQMMNRLDYSVWGLRPFGYHLTNLLYHIGSAMLAAELVMLLGFGALVALIMGSLFVVHPIIVQEIMIIAGRAELMGLFFTLSALLCFLRGKRAYDILGCAAYVLALLSKESALMLPFQLATLMLVRRDPLKAYWKPAALMLFWVPYLWARHHAVGALLPRQDLLFTLQFFIQAFPRVLFRYIGLMILPWNLHSHRMLPHLSHFWPLLLILLVAGSVYAVKRYGRYAAAVLLWIFIAFVPKTPIMIYGNFMLEHWAYPALLALLCPLACGIAKAWESRRRVQSQIAGTAYAVAVIVWALLVHLNVALRGTDEQMYRWALNFTYSSPIHYNLGVLLVQTGRAKEAIPHFAEVCDLYPENADYHHALGVAYGVGGYHEASRKTLEKVCRQHPDYLPAAQSLKALKIKQKKK